MHVRVHCTATTVVCVRVRMHTNDHCLLVAIAHRWRRRGCVQQQCIVQNQRRGV